MTSTAIAGYRCSLVGANPPGTALGSPQHPTPVLPALSQPRAAALVSPGALHTPAPAPATAPLGCLCAGCGWPEKAASHFDYFPQLCCKSHFNHGFPLYQVNSPILADGIAKAGAQMCWVIYRTSSASLMQILALTPCQILSINN